MRARTPSVLVVAPDRLGPAASGPARRAAKLAEAVAAVCPVTLAAPAGSQFPDGPYTTIDTGPAQDQRLAPAFAAHDVTVVQALPSPRHLLGAIRHCRHLVVDLIAPLAFEAAEDGAAPSRHRDAIARWRIRQLADHLAAADLVLCTNERQRDLFTGVLAAVAGSPPVAGRIAVVPHGLDPAPPPEASARPLRERGLVAAEDRLVVWGGGMWGWLDPLTPIQAVERLGARVPGLRLAFVGTGRGAGPGAGAGDRAVDYARERGLEGERVIFIHGWLDRGAYLDHLLEADVGITAHLDTLEGRYGTRTRVLDYLWAGLPVACTHGDAMSDFVAARGLGATAAPGDADSFAAAIDAALALESRHALDRSTLDPLLWRNVARPLVEYCRRPDALPPRPRVRPAARAARHYGAFLNSVYRGQGAGATARMAARRLRRP